MVAYFWCSAEHDDTPATSAMRKFGMAVSVLIAIFVVSMSASAFPSGVDLRASFINVFMTAVSALAYGGSPLREAPGLQAQVAMRRRAAASLASQR